MQKLKDYKDSAIGLRVWHPESQCLFKVLEDYSKNKRQYLPYRLKLLYKPKSITTISVNKYIIFCTKKKEEVTKYSLRDIDAPCVGKRWFVYKNKEVANTHGEGINIYSDDLYVLEGK